jgi:hypothetical protein
MDRFWTHFMPIGELVRGIDGTWMPAGDAYTGALKKIVNPGIEAYPASGLAQRLASDQPAPTYQAQVSSVVEPPQPPPAADGGGITAVTIGLVVAGALRSQRSCCWQFAGAGASSHRPASPESGLTLEHARRPRGRGMRLVKRGELSGRHRVSHPRPRARARRLPEPSLTAPSRRCPRRAGVAAGRCRTGPLDQPTRPTLHGG